jgi:two-component system, NtrC family, sensor kinase
MFPPNTTIEPFCVSNIDIRSLELDSGEIKILIVDDNPDNLRLLSRILTECGYSVQRAISGRLALNAIRVNAPHLILLDVLMPDLNGYEVCEILKSDDQTCEIPVIFLSALTEELNKVKAFELGGADYITKPFQSKEILIRIKHQLTILGLQRQLQQKNQALTDRNLSLQAEIRERQQAEDALKQSESQLKLANQQLENTVKRLKHTQAQLIQTEKMSSLGQMMAGIAHEINNPVNFIYGNISHAASYIRDLLYILQTYQDEYPQKTPKLQEILEDIDLDFLKDDLPKLLNSMQFGSDRIRQIVLSLRNFSRLDESTLKSVDLHEGIDSALLILRHQFQANKNQSEIQLHNKYAKLPKVTCNAGQINQVFMNILSNAIDALADYRRSTFAAQGDRIPTIGIRTEFSHANRVKIQISDNGSGMSEEVRQQIFDPFFTTKPVGSGSGLGLSISYSIIVEEHGGQIDCHSEVGVGTQVTIELPVQPERKYSSH